MVREVSLNGSWQFREAGASAWHKAAVPGCVHTDLLRHGLIPDPFYRRNEDQVQWIGEKTWEYRRNFRLNDEFLSSRKIILRCEGLDLFAVIKINGRKAASADNMHRTWEFDVGRLLKKGNNEIAVTFAPVLPYIRKKERQRTLPSWNGLKEIAGGGWVRKEQCNFGWDWGPALTTCGIWRSIGLVAFEPARITGIRTSQKHGKKQVRLQVGTAVERTGREQLDCTVTVTYNNRVVAEKTVPVKGRAAEAVLTIKNPKLWWPNGMGEQPLYDVTVDLTEAGGALADSGTRRIGLRTLELVQKKDRWGQSFHFACNGVPFFAKGGNWIPADAFATRVTPDDYRRLIADTREANMNMLRVWGGGIYEDDLFYDLCDEMGICVWQDFMFACSTYPSFDPAFMDSVKAEAVDNVRRIRHHACLALWCGNNELEQGLVSDDGWDHKSMSWADYKELFDRLLPAVVKKENPETPYWPCSPHTPVGDRSNWLDPTSGDCHLWAVWHGKEPFEWYRTCEHRFNSEFGFQSFPEPFTMETVTESGDRNVTSAVMEHHQRSGIGNTTIMQYMLSWFLLPKDFDSTLWVSQIQQGMAMKYAVEHWRRSMPRGMGTLYWQINDCWPVASWSSLDYYGRWKALHHMAKRFYNPLLVSGLEDMEKGTCDVHVTSDLLKQVKGTVAWKLTGTDGKTITDGEEKVTIPANRSRCALKLDFGILLDRVGRENVLLWLELTVHGGTVSENLVLFARPKHLALEDPRLAVAVKPRPDGSFTVTLKSRKPALWAWLNTGSLPCRFSDNFFHMEKGKAYRVLVRPEKKVSAGTLERHLTAASLISTY